VTFLAGGLAFNILLAGVPFILLLASALGYLYGESLESSTELVQRVLDRLLPPQLDVEGSMLDPVLSDVQRTRAIFGIGGGVGFLYFSARLFGSLRSVMGTVFAHGRDRGFLKGMLWDIHLSVMTVVLGVAWIIVSAWVTVSSGRIGGTLAEFGVREEVWSGAQVLVGRLIAAAVLVALFAALYRWLPKKKTDWIPCIAGGITAAALFEAARSLFSLLVRTFPPGSIYSGTLGALVVVVFWTYYAAMIFIVGAEVASATREYLTLQANEAAAAEVAEEKEE
jgi:membrane protein